MNKSILLFFAALCAAALAYGTSTVARAEWRGPPVMPQLPQQPLSPPPMPQTLPNNYLQPTLKDLPSAPKVVTENGQNSSDTGHNHDNSAHDDGNEPLATETQPAVNEVQQEPAPVDTQTLPPSGPSSSKTPWLLAVAVVAGAFFLGRRSR